MFAVVIDERPLLGEGSDIRKGAAPLVVNAALGPCGVADPATEELAREP